MTCDLNKHDYITMTRNQTTVYAAAAATRFLTANGIQNPQISKKGQDQIFFYKEVILMLLSESSQNEFIKDLVIKGDIDR